MTTLLPSDITGFAGDVLVPGDAEYDQARRVVNAAIDRHPAMIARCAGAHDVAAAVRHARGHGLAVTVRGGGHAPGGFAVADGGLMIDLGRMRAVHVDPGSRRARVQGGATWRELDAATQEHGLAVTGARMPSVGVAGFTLGSGSGWLERKLGLAADSLQSARVVTDDGDVVTTSRERHPELFWALRGGATGFGIVVELEFELHPVGPLVLGGMLGWAADRTEEVAAAFATLMDGAPDDLSGGIVLASGPPASFVPEVLQGAPIIGLAILWNGAAEEGEALIRPLRELAPAFDAVGPLPYVAFQGMFEPPVKVAARSHIEAGFLSELPAHVLADVAAGAPSPISNVIIQPMGGAFGRVAEDATPLGRRDAAWHWQSVGAWFEPAQDDAARAWTIRARETLAPWSHGESYPNFIAAADPERLRGAYAPAVWERLRTIRAEWDPENVFGAGHAVPLPPRRGLAH